MKKIIILLLLSLSATVCFAEEAIEPLLTNQGTIYEYDRNNIPDVCFFPVEEAKWNGYEVTISNWGELTDFQKSIFISEGLDELVAKGQIEEQEINGWDVLIAMNHMASAVGGDVPMVKVLKDLLQQEQDSEIKKEKI